MNKQITMVGGIACVLVLAGAGCFASQKEAVDTSVNTESTEEQMEGEQIDSVAIAAGTYQVNTEASTVTWFGKRTVGNQHRGTVELTNGEVTFADDSMLTAGNFAVDMNTIEEDENNERLETHLRSDDFFAVETHPTTTFVITSATKGDSDMYDITGDLTIKGITNSITFPATIVVEDGNVRATATFFVDRAAFDVQYGSGSFFDDLGDSLIEDNMEFTLDLVATMSDSDVEMVDDESMMDSDDDTMVEDDMPEEEMMDADTSEENGETADVDVMGETEVEASL